MKTASVKTLLLAFFVMVSCALYAQTFTPRYSTTIDYNTPGFYEYLPQGYSSGSEFYPLLVFCHGIGERGNGGPTDLTKVINNGPPKLMANGTFPVSFTVGGKTFKFIAICPQFINWPSPVNVNAVIDYATSHYRVDMNRIYVTGLSMGGGAVWSYAGDNSAYAMKIAAIVPVCGAAPGVLSKDRIMANANLPVWATHNDGDPTVSVWNTINNVNYINQAPAPNPNAKMTIFTAASHNAWTKSYDPNFREGGLNVYEWMLQYSRNITILPVQLHEFTAHPDVRNQVQLAWNASQQDFTVRYFVEKSTDGVNFTSMASVDAGPTDNYTITDPAPGASTVFYRLSSENTEGKRTTHQVVQVELKSALVRSALRLYPVPAQSELTLDFSPDKSESIRLEIVSSNGAVMMSSTKNFTAGKQQVKLTVGNYPAGIYQVRIVGTGELLDQQTFVKL